jgi:hypothetical protein
MFLTRGPPELGGRTRTLRRRLDDAREDSDERKDENHRRATSDEGHRPARIASLTVRRGSVSSHPARKLSSLGPQKQIINVAE